MLNGLRRLAVPSYSETALYDAVYDTLERLESVRGKKAIFLLSAGLDTISKHNYGEVLKNGKPDKLKVRHKKSYRAPT